MNDENKQSTQATREAENENAGGAAAVAGAVAGGLIGAAAGPAGAAVGAAAGGAIGSSAAKENAKEIGSAEGAVSGRGPQDERFADPKTDVDWRTSDSGLTSVGASDENSDTATIPSDQPGVRSGDADTPNAQRNLERTRSSISDESDMNQAGLDVGPLTNPDSIGNDTPPANQVAPNADVSPKDEPARNKDVPSPASPTSSSSTTSLPAGGSDVSSSSGQQTIGGNLPQM